jgi:hypothetical protein
MTPRKGSKVGFTSPRGVNMIFKKKKAKRDAMGGDKKKAGS